MATPSSNSTAQRRGRKAACLISQPLQIRMQGLTLIELMVALVITSIILIALTRVFVSSRHTYQTDEGLARLQENVRFAVQFLSRDLRMVGNAGCMGEPRQPKPGTSGGIVNYLNVSIPFDFSTPIRGYDAIGPVPGVPYALPPLYPPSLVASTNPALDGALAPWGAVAGSDVVVVRFMNGDSFPINAGATTNASVVVARPHNITQNQVVMASDCEKTVFFQVTGVAAAGADDVLTHLAGAGPPGNICSTWGSACGQTLECRSSMMMSQATGLPLCPGAQIGQFRVLTYFIGNGGPATASVPSLYRAVFDETGAVAAEELVEGVENMQITYGVDTDGDIEKSTDRYMTAAQVTDWSRVRTVRVGLLLATSYSTTSQTEQGTDTTPFYEMGGMAQISVPSDNRRRRVVVETIKIRNRPADKL